MVKNVQKDHPLLINFVAKFEAKSGTATQKGVAELIGMKPVEFSKLLNGLRPIPDPRDPENLKLYSLIAETVDKSVAEVIGELLPTENLSHFWKGFYGRKAEQSKPTRIPISTATREKVALLCMNLPSTEEYLDVLLANLRTYIKDVKKWRWLETPSDLKNHLDERKEV